MRVFQGDIVRAQIIDQPDDVRIRACVIAEVNCVYRADRPCDFIGRMNSMAISL